MIVMLGDWHVSKQIISSQKYTAMPTKCLKFVHNLVVSYLSSTSEEELKIEAFLL